MAEMVFSAVVQEAMSKSVSSVFFKREEESQGNLTERLEMAIYNLEFALERSAKLPIMEVSLLQRRKIIKRAYIEAMELLEKQKSVQGQEEITHRLKRKRSWITRAKSLSISSFVGLKMDHVRRFEWFADCASKFVRDVESGCSLQHYTFHNPIVRNLLEGKTLMYELEQGNQLRHFYIWPTSSEERGVEARLEYVYKDITAMEEKSFGLTLSLRLSESTDIVGVATKCLRFLTSQFKLADDSAIGELTLLPILLQGIDHSYVPPWVGIQELHKSDAPFCRPDPACCKASRHGLCGKNSVSSELQHIFPEQVNCFSFIHYISALDPSSHSSSDETGKSVGRGWMSPLAMAVAFVPHFVPDEMLQDTYAVGTIENANNRSDASIEQVAKTVKSDAIDCFLRQPQLTEYTSGWHSKHGAAWFEVYKPRILRTRRLQQVFQATTMHFPVPFLGHEPSESDVH